MLSVKLLRERSISLHIKVKVLLICFVQRIKTLIHLKSIENYNWEFAADPKEVNFFCPKLGIYRQTNVMLVMQNTLQNQKHM